MVRVCDDGRLQFDPIGWAHVSAFRSIAYSGGVLRAGEITPENLGAFQRAVGRSPESCPTRTSQEVTLTFESGLVERRRVVRICDNGVLHFEPRGHAHLSNFTSIAYEGGRLTTVTPASLQAFYRALGMRPVSCPSERGVACTCEPATRTSYDEETFRFLRSARRTLVDQSTRSGVPVTAVAGAIADEYNTRRGLRSVVDGLQDLVLDSLPEVFIDVDRFFDIKAKLLNALENDVGAANINVRTALELVQSEELSVPGSPPTDAQVSRIIDFLLTERGTIAATAAVIRRAQRLFTRYLWGYPQVVFESVLVTYFKQGDSYYNRAMESLRTNPDHEICPGEGGCRVHHNWGALLAATAATR